MRLSQVILSLATFSEMYAHRANYQDNPEAEDSYWLAQEDHEKVPSENADGEIVMMNQKHPAKQNKDEKKNPKKWQIPFNHNIPMESIGLVLMFILIALSNAGGLSGAGSNIPIMLIFYSMNMESAVPISAFVAVCATSFRFLLNFNQTHPKNPNRNCINYEIVSLAMPAVFLGSFFGVILGQMVGELVQLIVFGTTVAWSIMTTSKKVCKLLEEEKELSSQQILNNQSNSEEPLLDGSPDIIENNGKSEELKEIEFQEKNHITSQRIVYILVCFGALLTTQVLFGSKAQKTKLLPDWGRYLVLSSFVFIMIMLTYYNIQKVQNIHEIKNKDGYKFDVNDYKFESSTDIIKLCCFCMIAAGLCGMTGIAGGMVLGPLFLTYNMLPSIMSGTNQYITMIASISVAVQFAFIGKLNPYYSGLFGFLTLISAFVGIKSVNIYIKKTGKQSRILICLIICLTLALVSLPINYILKQNAKKGKLDGAGKL